MGLTTSLFTALSGLSANSQAINVSGNNIANVNATAFKASRAVFETQISETLSSSSAPTADVGGVNGAQVGLGTKLGTVSRNFNDGSIQPTGVNTDLAIEGNGFFVLGVGNDTRFTRAGAFSLNSNFNLVNPDGGLLQGFGVDDNFNVIEGVLTDVTIPVGALSLAKATENVPFEGILNAGGDNATLGSVSTAAATFSNAGATIPATATDALTTLFDAGGTALFSTGDVITLRGVTKGSAEIPDRTFEVGPANTTGSDDFGTTAQDFMDFLEAVLGIDTSVGGGVAFTPAGELTVTGNSGTVNQIVLEPDNIIVNLGTANTQPFDFATTQDANGESVRTTFVAYDSLGNPLTVDIRVVLESTSNSGTVWRFYAQSEDDTSLSSAVGTGTLTFDTEGQLLAVTGDTITVDRDNTGAMTPQDITLAFATNDGSNGGVTALSDQQSQISANNQDGAPVGTLEDFSIQRDGTVTGIFSNGLNRNLAQIALATFVNPQGLAEIGSNLFDTSPNSGTASIGSPAFGGAGEIVGGALELSNVDLSQEFINLIIFSTGFSANSRVLTTSDRLIQELIATIR